MGETRIIVVEDQEDLAALYEATLRKAGYTVVNAYTGEEGVAEFRTGGADAVLLDITLPEMNGVQVLQEIRALSPQVPVIIITGETSEETRTQCERLGVFGYLAKPPDYDAVLTTVRLALSEPADEEYQVVTLRLPTRVVDFLFAIDANFERAVTRLCDECDEKFAQTLRAASGKQ